MNQVLRLKSKPEIEKQLKDFPTDLTEAYQTIFDKIGKLDGFQPAIAKRAFQWLLASQSGEIETSILRAAVWQRYDSDGDNTQDDDNSDDDNDADADHDSRHRRLILPPVGIGSDYILDACQHLLVDEFGYTRWSHISIREYLLDYKRPWVARAAVTVGSVCLLALTDTSAGRSEFKERIPEETSLAALRRYSCREYGTYLKALDMAEADSPLRNLLSRFLGASSPLQPSPFSLLADYKPTQVYQWRDNFENFSSPSEASSLVSPSAAYQTSKLRQSGSGEHPIWPVCHYGLESSFEELCHAGLDDAFLHKTSFILGYGESHSLLGMAIIGQSAKIFETLLKLGVKPTKADIEKATEQGQISYLKLLDNYSGRFDCISVAVEYLSLPHNTKEPLFQRLLEYGEGSRGTEWSGWYLLRQRILQYDKDAVCALLREGINPNYVDPKNLYCDPPLVLAVDKYTKSIVQILLDNKADPNGTEHSRPLLHACEVYRGQKWRIDVVRLLLDSGADPNKTQVSDPVIYGALHQALSADYDSSLLLEFLLERGADPNGVIRDDTGRIVGTILSFAIERQFEDDILQLLVDNGALVDGEGESLGLPPRIAFLYDRLPFFWVNGVDTALLRREWIDEDMQKVWTGNRLHTARQVKERLLLVQDNGGPVTDTDVVEIQNAIDETASIMATKSDGSEAGEPASPLSSARESESGDEGST